MDWTKKLYQTLATRRAFIEGATEGKFGMNVIKAENLARAKYPLPRNEGQKGELPEIAEAMRVPAPEIAPRNSEGEDKEF